MEDDTVENSEFAFQNIGERLREERERRGLTLDDIAGTTRVPIRHLQAIEASQYDKLPGSTYCIGFTRSYARALEMDQNKIADELREELAESGVGSFKAPTPSYEPTDPSSVPSRILAWTAAAIGIFIIGGFLVWRSYFMDGPADGGASDETEMVAEAEMETEKSEKKSAPAAPNPDGQVTLTAKDVVWLKIYDADNKRVYEAEMKAGDSYQIPKDANGPMIVTGRPEMLVATIDGKTMAPLGVAERTISDVGVSAAALIKREAEAKAAAKADAAKQEMAPTNPQ